MEATAGTRSGGGCVRRTKGFAPARRTRLEGVACPWRRRSRSSATRPRRQPASSRHIFRRDDSGTTLTPVRRAERRRGGTSFSTRRRSIWKRAGRSPTPADSSGTASSRPMSGRRTAPTGLAAHARHRRTRRNAAGRRYGAGRGRRRAPRRHSSEPYRDAPAARGAAPDRGHARQAEGIARRRDRLRFDITHHEAVTPDQLHEIERLVNNHVIRNQTVETEERSTEEAIAAGAMALFGEKYGERVRVVTVPGFSVELCGGTHCGRPATSARSSSRTRAAWRPGSGESRQ